MKPLLPLPCPIVVCAVALAACGEGAGPPPLPLPPAGLAFVGDQRLGQRDIYFMGTDRTLTNLTPTSLAYDGWPAWSPDGAKIAFESDRSADPTAVNLNIYVMNADGSGLVRLTADTTNEF